MPSYTIKMDKPNEERKCDTTKALFSVYFDLVNYFPNLNGDVLLCCIRI